MDQKVTFETLNIDGRAVYRVRFTGGDQAAEYGFAYREVHMEHQLGVLLLDRLLADGVEFALLPASQAIIAQATEFNNEPAFYVTFPTYQVALDLGYDVETYVSPLVFPRLIQDATNFGHTVEIRPQASIGGFPQFSGHGPDNAIVIDVRFR